MQQQEQNRFSGRGRLEDLVQELDRQRESKIDFVADTREMLIEVTGGESNALALAPRQNAVQLREFIPEDGILIRDQALTQIGDRQTPRVPGKFLRELTTRHPFTSANLLNDLLSRGPKRNLVRCLDDRVRAFLSDSYKVIDNYDIAFVALEAARQNGGQVLEASLSDSRMRIKFTTREVWDRIVTRGKDGGAGSLANEAFVGRTAGWNAIPQEDLPGGPGTVHPLVEVSNSETGQGGFNVSLGFLQAVCINGLIIDKTISRVHLGSKLDAGLLTQETLAHSAQTVFLQARDVVSSAFDQTRFKALVAKAKAAQDVEVKAPSAAVEQIVSGAYLGEDARDTILEYFLSDYDRTAYGLAQGVSRYAQDVEDPEDAAALETLAGNVIARPQMAVVS